MSARLASLTHDPIRVLVADDHAAARVGLKLCVAAFDDLCLVGEATNGEEALSLCDTTRPDVVLLDVMMPVMDGIAATRAICRAHPNIRVIVITCLGQEYVGGRAQEAGAFLCLSKDASADDLASAIRAAWQDARPAA